MSPESTVPLVTLAAATGFFHTLVGPDHYLPFVVLARARSWSAPRTMWVTALCGIGHVLGSVLLGAVGIAIGIAVFRMESIESVRGTMAAWFMVTFGVAYAVWGLWRALRGRTHRHVHVHADGSVHDHEHDHRADHAHVHVDEGKASITPWVLFTIFVFGPCEVLIPQLMVPAAMGSHGLLWLVVGTFGAATVLTMLGMVLVLSAGLRKFPLGGLDRYSHALAGAAVGGCGGLILAGF